MSSYRPNIKVFITKTMQIRVRIKEEKNTPPYEVTVGGEEWQKGKGSKFHECIKLKALNIARQVTTIAESM